MSDLSDILKFLDQVKATADAATKGPWEKYQHDGPWPDGVRQSHSEQHTIIQASIDYEQCGVNAPHDATFIAESRQRIPQLEQALRVAVEKLEACKNAVELLQGTSSRGAIEFRETLHTIATICQP